MPDVDSEQIGQRMHASIAELYPVCRSIAGNGLRQTLARTREEIPIETFDVPTGTTVFDWTVPKGVERPRRVCGQLARRGHY